MRVIGVLLFALVFAAIGLTVLYWTAPAAVFNAAIAAERWASGLDRREIESGSTRMVYLDNGRSGESLVLVHGFGGDKDNWLRVARPLKARYRILAPDLPGYGESAAPADARYRVEDNVERLHAFIQALGLTRVHLGGHSMGGHIVAAYAAKYPNEVGSLWLIANAGVKTAALGEVRGGIAKGERNPLIATTQGQYRELLGVVMAQPPFLPDRLMRVMAERAIRASALRARQFADLTAADAPALEDTIKGLPIASHILWGDKDRVLDVSSVAILKTLLPQASSTVLAGIGHVPMLEAPTLVAEDYLTFRKGLVRPAP
ncbi:MAG: alpha/beta fold hydrolase [Panacagrimonas sp.]